MRQIIEYIMLEDEQLPKDKYIEIEEMLGVAKSITIETIFKIFLEGPTEFIMTAICYNKQPGMNQIVYDAHLKEAYYQKHIGKFTKEAQEQIMTELVNSLIDELNKINWKAVGWGGEGK